MVNSMTLNNKITESDCTNMKFLLINISIIFLLNQFVLGQSCDECLKKNDVIADYKDIKSIAEMPVVVNWENVKVGNIFINTCISTGDCVEREAYYINYEGYKYWVGRKVTQHKSIDTQCSSDVSIIDSVHGISNLFPWFEDVCLKNMKKYYPQDFQDLFSSKNYDPFYLTYFLPTSWVENKYYFSGLINYDCTGVTFGFIQFAAHTKNYNFILLLKEFMKEYPDITKTYFKDLIIKDGRINKMIDENTYETLENNISTIGLKKYFKPSYNYISDTEIVNAAKLIHLSQFRKEFRECQVLLAKRIIIDDLLNTYACEKLGILLNNLPDYMIILITDRYHQNGAGTKTVQFKYIINKYFIDRNVGNDIDVIKADVINYLYSKNESDKKYEKRGNEIIDSLKKLIKSNELGVKKYNYYKKTFENIN